MASIIFFEKPGCQNNTRQKALLRSAGHEVEPVNLLEYPWSSERLLPFLKEMAVSEWFNPSAPAVKSGTIDPSGLSSDEALALMCASPILIRRPLMIIDGRCFAGFDIRLLSSFLSLEPSDVSAVSAESPATIDLNSCPHSNNPCINKEK